MLAAAAGENPYGLMQALEEGGAISWATFIVLVGMSIGTFYILFTKFLQQQKIINQGKKVRSSFWNAPNLRDASSKLDQKSAYRAIVEDALVAQDQHSKLIMTALGLVVAVPAVLAYNWLIRRNKTITEDLSAFTNDVHGYLASNGAVKPAMASGPRTTAQTKTGAAPTQRGSEPLRTGMTSTGAPATPTTTTTRYTNQPGRGVPARSF